MQFELGIFFFQTRLKIISKLPEKNKNVLSKLTASLNGKVSTVVKLRTLYVAFVVLHYCVPHS